MTIRQLSNSRNETSTLQLSLLAAGTFVLGTDGFVLPGLLPAVARDLGVGVATAGQLTTVFAIVYAISSPLIATVTGRLDRRFVLAGGMAVFLAGMVAQATGPTFVVVLLGRVLAGVGAAAFQSNAYAVAGFLAPPERRARALAVVAAGTSVATVLGVPLGVFFGQLVGWRGAMWLIAALALVAGAATVALPPVHVPSGTLRQRLLLFGSPRLLTLLLVSALVLVPVWSITSYVAPLVGGRGESSPLVLVALFGFGIAFLAGNRAVGRLTDGFGPVRVLAAGLVLAACALIALGLVRPSPVPTVAALSVLGFVAPSFSVPQQTRIFAAGGDSATLALGLNGSMLYLGSAAGAGMGGVVVAVAGVAWLPAVAALVAVVVLAVTLLTAGASAGTSRSH